MHTLTLVGAAQLALWAGAAFALIGVLVVGWLVARVRLLLKAVGTLAGMLSESDEGVVTIQGKRYRLEEPK